MKCIWTSRLSEASRTSPTVRRPASRCMLSVCVRESERARERARETERARQRERERGSTFRRTANADGRSTGLFSIQEAGDEGVAGSSPQLSSCTSLISGFEFRAWGF